MPLQSFRAEPLPDGHRIELRWTLPADWSYAGVRIVRLAGRYPNTPDDGVLVVDAETDLSVETDLAVIDSELQGEQWYYYAAFPYAGVPRVYEYEQSNRCFTLASSPQGCAALLSKLLPEIYHRYDQQHQVLDRLLGVVAGQLDLFFSQTKALTRQQSIEQTAGPLLPALAQWVGWRNDYQLGFDGQREALQHAPALYHATGLPPTVEATIKRISQWESRSKEYVHNVFASNRPERHNLWALRATETGWENVELLLSLDHATAGAASFATDGNECRWLFYHTWRRNQWEVWYKTSPWYRLELAIAASLQPGVIALSLQQALLAAGVAVSQTATLAVEDHGWRLLDAGQRYFIEPWPDHFRVFHTNAAIEALAPSEALITTSANQQRPSVAAAEDQLWLFWQIWLEAEQQWRIRYRRRQAGTWSAIAATEVEPDLSNNPFAVAGAYDDSHARRTPSAMADGADLWLTWLARTNDGWRIFYNRFQAGAWATPVQLPPIGDEPFSLDDLAIHVDVAGDRILIFWAQPVATAQGERWRVAYRLKSNRLPDASGWGPVQFLPLDGAGNYSDREPHLHQRGGAMVLYWSSNRDSAGWSIWQAELSDPSTNTWLAASRLTAADYSQRAPCVMRDGDSALLLYRSNRVRLHESAVYRASQSRDDRYAGSLLLDPRHADRLVLREAWEDSLRYSYDTGHAGLRDDGDRIARDTVGAFVETDTLSESAVQQGIARLRPVMREFVPATDRVVFIPTQDLHTDFVYHYDRPTVAEARFIEEELADEFVSTSEESLLLEGEDFADELD